MKVKRAFSLAFFVIGLIALATLFVFKSPNDERGGLVNQPTLNQTQEVVPNEMAAQQIQGDNVKTDNPPAVQRSQAEIQSLSKKFLNSQLPLEDRLDAWMEIQKQKPIPSESLTQIAKSPNPFENVEKKEHSVEELNFRREESFRIMALQSLERAAIENPQALSWIEDVSKTASSPVVRKIAQKMHEFAQKGMSYTDLFEKAVSSEPPPQ